MKKTITACLFLLLFHCCFSQEEDSLKILGEVTVRAFEQNRTLNLVAAPVKVLEYNNADRNNKTSLVSSLNTIAGVRMEERSPGSYRINIRGSSLRSPFGVRNVKVYWNDIPLTDAGGNTYFNQLAYNNFSSIEIFKGPAGSLYGAGTGGLILVNNFDNWQPGVSLEYTGGSYNLQNIFGSARWGTAENRTQITYAHNETDGYREQTKMKRDNFSWISQLKLSGKHQLTASVLFTDMYYQTPGALTLTEYINNPKAARPAGGGFPSAVNAKAAIYQKNVLAGFTNQYNICSSFANTTTLYGTFSQIKNPAIRNYERRNEPGFGGRSFFTWKKKQETATTTTNSWQLIAGGEFQQGYFNTQVSKNKNGNPDTLQTNDDIRNQVYSLFFQGDISLEDKWLIAAGMSLNKTKVSITRLNKYPVTEQSRRYRNEIAPRLSIRRNFEHDFSVLASVAKGFSPPTLAELLPSTGVISTELEAEHGWNYELSVHQYLFRKKLQVEATGFYFKLNEALVQRRDLSGADFFVNAGDVVQKGIELHADLIQPFSTRSLFDYLIVRAAYAHNHFRYGHFIKTTDDFSGKTVPSVPSNTFSALADLQLKNGFYTNATFYLASKIFLNDANTASAEEYHLLGARIGWKKTLRRKYKLNCFAGADNLLDEQYSLGNDINAAAGRYYNAAPRRNYYAGLALQWIKNSKN